MNDIARKIRALLDKAESTEFDHERETFISKATALMVQHNIDQAMVDANGQKVDRGEIMTRHLHGEAKGPYALARSTIMGAACAATGATTWRQNGNIIIVGFKDQLDASEALYTSLLLQASTELERSYSKRHGNRMSYTRNFLLSFGGSAWRKIEEAASQAKKTAEDSSPGSSLVLLDAKAQIDSYLEDQGVKIVEHSTQVHGQGHLDGSAAGRRADVGTKSMGSRLALT